jgi:hypothetical protein
MRVTASGRIKPGTFRLKAGPGISPVIALRVGQSSEDGDQ